MEFSEAKEQVKRYVRCEEFLQKAPHGGYICPYPDCKSGTHKNGTGAVKVYADTNSWYCHSCGKGGDVITLYQAVKGLDFMEALKELAQREGITLSLSEHKEFKSGKKENPPISAINAAKKDEPPKDYTEYYEECFKRIENPLAVEYLNKRGISIETAKRFKVGYDPEWKSPAALNNGKNPPASPRIILPTCNSHYVARDIRSNLNDTENKFKKMNEGKPALFNTGTLYTEGQCVFIVEGYIDALSFLEVGADAIALNSTANKEKLIEELENKRTNKTLILALDADKSGRAANEYLRAELTRINIPFICIKIGDEGQDPNDILAKDRQEFIQTINTAKRQAGTKPDSVGNYLSSIFADDLARFNENKNKKTGYNIFDQKAGGLHSGLYILGAVPSLGKTTYATQMADQLAERGNDVIFFSLEQSRLELVTKSIARRMAKKNISMAKTSLQIREAQLNEEVFEAIEEHEKLVGDNLNIVEGNFDCDVSFICDYIRRYVYTNNTRPIVFIDYLQQIQPTNDDKKQTTKTQIDDTLTTLKRLSRDLDLTIFCISSLNRANYLYPIDFTSFKETGGIEYTADCVLGLQLYCLNEDLFAKDKQIKEKRERIKAEKSATPRRIELVCLKNRYGISSFSCFYRYNPRFDYFEEVYQTEIADKEELV